MLKVKSGNVEMLGLLYERYKKWLYNFFQQMYYNTDVSEDLVQNVFVRILKYKHTYTEDSKFVTWLFQIARNESHSYFNKHVKNRNQVDLDVISYKLSDQNSIEQTMENDEEIKLLNEAIKKLPYEKKEIITLSKLKQLKYKEIGAILGCSEANARIKSHRALQDLKTTYMSMQKS
jgi:RNA polymerase sigma-70 factor (ECF subfamily)